MQILILVKKETTTKEYLRERERKENKEKRVRKKERNRVREWIKNLRQIKNDYNKIKTQLNFDSTYR